MNMDLLKQEKNRGYVIAGGAGIIALIAFFLPYVTASFLGYSASASGSNGGWLWLEEIGALVVVVAAAMLLFRNNAFGLSNMPVEKQILYGRYAIIGGAVLALLLHLLFAINVHSAIGDVGTTAGVSVGLGFGWWLFLLAAIAMGVGGVLALRSPVQAATSYPPYQQPYNPQYPPYQAPQYPPYQQPQQGQTPFPTYSQSDQQPSQYPPYQQGQAPQYPPYQPNQAEQPQQYPQQYPPTQAAQPPQYPPQQPQNPPQW